MDRTTLVFLGFALIGVAYFFFYRLVLNRYLKWKMLHSIWLPLAVSVLSLFLGFVAYQSTGGWGDLVAIVLVLMFNYPVVAFFLLYFGDLLLFRRKKALKAK